MLSSPSFAARHALVGRSVRVQLRRDRTFAGGVLVGVDPESGDVALLQPPAGVKILLGHAVESVELDAASRGTTLESIRAELTVDTPAAASSSVTQEERDALTQRLCALLDERFIPHAPARADPAAVEVFGGAATLRFPFDPRQSVECANEQILLRLQSLLSELHG